MGNTEPKNFNADGRTSLGDLSKYDTFEEAFAEAHSRGGNEGHTFSYKGEIHSATRSDG